MHKSVDLPILYFGTPVILISTLNEDGSTNIAPSSSIWWLGKSCMIGLDGSSKTTENLKRTRECVLNLASADMVEFVDRIANTTGSKSPPLHKRTLGYRYVQNKAEEAQLTTQSSLKVNPPRVTECQIQLEASVDKIHGFSDAPIPMFAFELKIRHSHIEESLLMGDKKQYVNPDKWHPLIMSFRKFYTTNNYIHPSRLEKASVEAYRIRSSKRITGKTFNAVISRLYRKYRQ
jgi:flavin reductase (DIM6/NTAB) family NADH-FMN oxidoreductase RutF